MLQEEFKILKVAVPGFMHALLLIVIAAVFSFFIGLMVEYAGNYIPAIKTWNIFLTYTLSFLLVLVFAVKTWNVPKFDTQKVGLGVYALLIPLIFAMSILLEGVVNQIPMSEKIKQLFDAMIQLNWPGYLTLGIVAPILEELIFRGVILKKFLEKYKPNMAIFLSAIIFGIAHLNPWQFIAAFSIGYAIGWIYWKTQSIWPGIFIHFINNSFSFYMAKKFDNLHITFFDIIGNTYYYIGLIILSLLVCYTVYIVLNKYFTAMEQKHLMH